MACHTDAAPHFQVECHPYLSQNNLIEFCRKNGILITAYSPLGGPTGFSPVRKEHSPEPLKDPKIQQLADKYGKTAAQIILRYLVSLKEEFCTIRSGGFKKCNKN